jgi:hypothetical protein
MDKSMFHSMMGGAHWQGVAVKVALAVVVVMLVVVLVMYLCRIPMAVMRRRFKCSAGIDLNAAVVNKFLCRSSYNDSYSVKYLPKDNDESYYYELHLPQGYSRRQKRSGFPKSFIHVPGFIIETENPYTLWSLLEGISEAKDIDIVMSDQSDKMFVEPSGKAEISRMLPGGMVSDRMSSTLQDKKLSGDEKESLCVVMQEERWFKNSILDK